LSYEAENDCKTYEADLKISDSRRKKYAISLFVYPTMLRSRFLSSFFVVDDNFLHLYLMAMFLAKCQSILALDRVLVKREHLVRGNIKIPSESSYGVGHRISLISIYYLESA
jgi:hypothetical protein